ncbi:MAG: response regulator [Myxococcota bacterium]
MSISFRAKLIAMLATALLAFCTVLVGSALIGERQAADLADVERRLIPKLELGPRLEAQFERLTRSYQNAVSAQDSAGLETAWQLRNDLFESIRQSGAVLEPSAAAALQWAIQDYSTLANDVSRRLIAGETGEQLVDDMTQMQARQDRAHKLIRQSLGLRPNEVAAAFAAVRDASARAHRFRLGIGVASFALLLALSVWLSRSVINAVGELSQGFLRFARGDFSWRIPVRSDDELGRMAREANHMADNLQRLNDEHTRADWLKSGQAGLSDALRGDLEPRALATRSLKFLATRLEAAAAALYVANAEGSFELWGQYAALMDEAKHFRPGEGLLGQAALSEDLLVVEDVPDGYARVSSGLGEGLPRTLVFLPLHREGRCVGVIELGLFGQCSARAQEWLHSIREMLVVSLTAAESRAALEAQRKMLSEKNVELEQARLNLQEKAEELLRMSSYKSRFLANVSHELRTPLNSMLLLSQLLAQNEAGNLTPRQVEHAKTVHAAGEDLLSLINQILDLSKVEAGHQPVSLEAVPLQHFVERARRMFEPLAAEKGLALSFEIAKGLPETMFTDRQHVERILVNLLGNAVKFTERGRVSLNIARPLASSLGSKLDPARAIAFSVSDTGRGIAARERERIFAPFEQIESETDRRYAGTGLGLAIARESASLLGGELYLESTLGTGSTFTCCLPEHGLETETQPAAERRQMEVGQRHDNVLAALLIVEPDPAFAEQLLEIVRARGFSGVVATTGEQALSLARALRPHGVLIDAQLPDMHGTALMERLKQDQATQNLPMYVLPPHDTQERGTAHAAVGQFLKGAAHAKLVEAVRALTQQTSAGALRVLVVEDDADEGESLVRSLRRGDIDARWAESAEAALSALAHDSYACMILDLGLPDMDGLDLLEKLTQRTDVDPPRVIVHTGRALTREEKSRLEAYAEAVVTKSDSSVTRLIEEIGRFVSNLPDYATHEALLLNEPAARTSLQGAKLLLAEDDMRTVYAISTLLQASGAKVLIADSGRDALDVLAKNPDVDGVLMDVMMPEMDGYEAIRRLRQDPRFQTLPVVALTARAMKGERERCLQAGASGYLAKPVNGEQLLHTVGSWLSQHEEHGS